MNILGAEYELKIDNTLAETDQDGECRLYSQEILIRPATKMLEEHDSMADKEKRFREVLRHEIIHASLFESGLDEYSRDETLVNWISHQYPKLERLFRMCSCMEKDE